MKNIFLLFGIFFLSQTSFSQRLLEPPSHITSNYSTGKPKLTIGLPFYQIDVSPFKNMNLFNVSSI